MVSRQIFPIYESKIVCAVYESVGIPGGDISHGCGFFERGIQERREVR